MLKTVTRVMVIVIVLVLLLTAGLYLFANHDRIQDYSSNLLQSIKERFSKDDLPPVDKRETTVTGEPDEAEETMPEESDETEGTPPEGDGEDGDGEEGEEIAQPEEVTPPALPLFTFEWTRAPEETAERIIYILGSGTEGNMWLIKKIEDAWYIEAGPLYCRLGLGGLAVGWHTPGELYYSAPVADVSWPGTVSPLQRLALGIIGEDTQPYYIQSANTGLATNSIISLEDRDMKRLCKWLDPSAETLVGVFYAKEAGWTVEKGMAGDFVFLSDYAPTIREEVRYATAENFMGEPMEGYLGNRIVVTEAVAKALAKVQSYLETQGWGLLVYDGYRPARAVEGIFAWLEDPNNLTMKDIYYPDLDKDALPGIYLAENSPHTNGIAVDLTICNLETGKPVDMGTDFDFFSTASWYNSTEVTAAQQKNRTYLREVMARYGFEGYSAEWWHFNYNNQVTNGPYDFVIPQ